VFPLLSTPLYELGEDSLKKTSKQVKKLVSAHNTRSSRPSHVFSGSPWDIAPPFFLTGWLRFSRQTRISSPVLFPLPSQWSGLSLGRFVLKFKVSSRRVGVQPSRLFFSPGVPVRRQVYLLPKEAGILFMAMALYAVECAEASLPPAFLSRAFSAVMLFYFSLVVSSADGNA